eukprot:3553335-Alexandrium_andersonii.AAC.1
MKRSRMFSTTKSASVASSMFLAWKSRSLNHWPYLWRSRAPSSPHDGGICPSNFFRSSRRKRGRMSMSRTI